MKELNILKGIATSNMPYVLKQGNNNEKYYAEEILKKYYNKILKRTYGSPRIDLLNSYAKLIQKYPTEFHAYIHDWLMGNNYKKRRM